MEETDPVLNRPPNPNFRHASCVLPSKSSTRCPPRHNNGSETLSNWKMDSGVRKERTFWPRYQNFGLLCHLLLLTFAITSTNAVFVPFENCLEPSMIESDPLKLQFTPQFVSAVVDVSTSPRTVSVTIYGNVSGIATRQDYPDPDDPQWSDPEKTVGKIVDLDESNNKFSTMFSQLDVLSFTPYSAEPTRFCDSVIQGECPLGPLFDADPNDISQLHAISVPHNLTSSYSFTSMLSTVRIKSGDSAGSPLGCIAAEIVPDLGSKLNDALSFVPLVILITVGIATIFAATYSPWGTTDLFRWTSNYGRDEDLLRLVTPGFGDCLQYIQFVFLTGSLTLNYPGYYQPVVSRVGWSTLMFNESFVTHGNGSQPMLDGIYGVNTTYGLDRISKYIGMTDVQDIWAGMMIWLLAILGGVIVIIQLGFALRWIHRNIGGVPEEDLRAKNMPFTVGNVVRIVFNFFLLPIISLSMFQLVVTPSSPVFVVALASLLLVILIGFAAWLLLLIAGTRPRSYLFDDLPTVLLYGPLYNTFCDSAAPFALVSVLLTLIRGIAIGAVQPSGIAQIVLLAICEVVFVLTLVAFRPFDYPTSMNSYHAIFAFIRCLTILLSVAFVPTLKVPDAARGWIGYIILLLHAMVLVFGFFLNSIQTLVEVGARLAGAGGEGGAEGGAARGGLVKVFGMRQLSRRVPRKRHVPRPSINSEAAMLGVDMERPSTQLDGDRARSLSGSSAILLSRSGVTDSRISGGFESGSLYGIGPSRGTGSGPFTPTTPGISGGGSGSPRSGFMPLKQADTVGPYYRPPRQRRATLDGGSSRRQGSWTSGDWGKATSQAAESENLEALADPHVTGKGTPTPAYLGAPRDDPDGDADDNTSQPRTDYAVREVDFYYGVRGPALSNLATRKLKTGPADPTGPVSSASGWLQNLFGGKTKEKGKGFEVVRSARAPPPGLKRPPDRDTFPEPYQDDPGAPRDLSEGGKSKEPSDTTPQNRQPPSLPPIITSNSIELSRRSGSKRDDPGSANLPARAPTIPRKSSKRASYVGPEGTRPESIAINNESTPPENPRTNGNPDHTPQQTSSTESPKPGRLPFGSISSSTRSGAISIESSSNTNPETDEERTPRPSYRSAPLERFGSSAHARPTSMGYVQQHRTSDHIHEASSADTPFSGSAAELIREH